MENKPVPVTNNKSSFKSILKTSNHQSSHNLTNNEQQQKTETILLNDLANVPTGQSTANYVVVVNETATTTTKTTTSPSPVVTNLSNSCTTLGGGGTGIGIGTHMPVPLSNSSSRQASSKKKRSVENSSSSGGRTGGRMSNVDSQQNYEYATSSTSIEYRPSKTDNIFRFYITRLKHSLIISFLLLIPVQNFVLCFISQLAEQVNAIYTFNLR